jgi:hypothetical protein
MNNRYPKEGEGISRQSFGLGKKQLIFTPSWMLSACAL